MKTAKLFVVALGCVAALAMAGCSKQEKTIGGALIGGASGAVIGGAAGGAGGAVAGGAIGALAGGALGYASGDDK